jgi:hypothetical protein
VHRICFMSVGVFASEWTRALAAGRYGEAALLGVASVVLAYLGFASEERQ